MDFGMHWGPGTNALWIPRDDHISFQETNINRNVNSQLWENWINCHLHKQIVRKKKKVGGICRLRLNMQWMNLILSLFVHSKNMF